MPLSRTQLKAILNRLDWLDWIVWFGCGAWAAYHYVANGAPLSGFFAVLCLSCGGLQLAAQRFAWHFILGAWVLGLVFVTWMSFERGFTLWRVAAVGCAAWTVWHHYRDRPRFLAHRRAPENAESEPMCSIVLWLRESPYLDAAILGQTAARAYGVPFNEGEDCECFVVGEQMHYLMRVQEAFFAIHSVGRPYFDDPAAAAADLRELRRAQAAREHRAWLSVDFLRPSGNLPDEKIHDAIGRLLAEIAAGGAEVLAVFHPASGRIVPWEAAHREKLAGGDPLSVFADFDQVPVIQVDAGSAAMVEAVAEARRRWPEFLAAYHAAADKEPFSVKAPVTEAGRTEFIWINVKAIAADQIHGFLANDPVALGDLKLGSFVSVAVAELNDWVCPDPTAPERPLGLFTVKAVSDSGRR